MIDRLAPEMLDQAKQLVLDYLSESEEKRGRDQKQFREFKKQKDIFSQNRNRYLEKV